MSADNFRAAIRGPSPAPRGRRAAVRASAAPVPARPARRDRQSRPRRSETARSLSSPARPVPATGARRRRRVRTSDRHGLAHRHSSNSDTTAPGAVSERVRRRPSQVGRTEPAAGGLPPSRQSLRAQVGNRIAAFVGDDDVDGDELCFRAKCWRLLRLLLPASGIAPNSSRQDRAGRWRRAAGSWDQHEVGLRARGDAALGGDCAQLVVAGRKRLRWKRCDDT